MSRVAGSSTTVDDEDYEYGTPRPPRRRRRWLRRLLLVLLLLIVLAAGAVVAVVTWYRGQVDPSGPPGESVAVNIPQGTSTSAIGELLAAQGVVSDPRVFKVYVRLNPIGVLQSGDYRLNQNLSVPEAIAVLEKGPELSFQRLTVPEGLILTQIAERVATLPGRSAEKFLEEAASGKVRSKYQPAGSTNLEGFLLPETYNFEPKDDEAAVLRRMVSAFDDAATALGYDDAQAKVGVDAHQAIVVASLVERETRFGAERAKVASVIYNRLERDQLLQVDATVIFALGRTGERNIRVLFRDLEVDSPYNTYRYKGLPPGPIASPGKASLQAAIAPEDTNFYFYVVTEKSGEHSFATNDAGHSANIRKAERNGMR